MCPSTSVLVTLRAAAVIDGHGVACYDPVSHCCQNTVFRFLFSERCCQNSAMLSVGGRAHSCVTRTNCCSLMCTEGWWACGTNYLPADNRLHGASVLSVMQLHSCCSGCGSWLHDWGGPMMCSGSHQRWLNVMPYCALMQCESIQRQGLVLW